jgi:hypothetical protein
MGRKKKIDEEKKTKVSVALDQELLKYYRENHYNLSSIVNKLLKEFRVNGKKDL